MTLSFRTIVLYLFSFFLVLGFSACDDDGMSSNEPSGFMNYAGDEYDLSKGYRSIFENELDSTAHFVSILLHTEDVELIKEPSFCLSGMGSRISLRYFTNDLTDITGDFASDTLNFPLPGTMSTAFASFEFTANEDCSLIEGGFPIPFQDGNVNIQTIVDSTYHIQFNLANRMGETITGEFTGELEFLVQ